MWLSSICTNSSAKSKGGKEFVAGIDKDSLSVELHLDTTLAFSFISSITFQKKAFNYSWHGQDRCAKSAVKKATINQWKSRKRGRFDLTDENSYYKVNKKPTKQEHTIRRTNGIRSPHFIGKVWYETASFRIFLVFVSCYALVWMLFTVLPRSHIPAAYPK